MNIVMLSSLFQEGHASANGLCAYEIKTALESKGHNVKVICYESKADSINDNIIEIPDKIWKGALSVSSKRLESYLYTLKSFFQVAYSKELKKAYIRSLEALYSDCNFKIDLIIAMYFPIETVAAMYEFKTKHNDIQCIIYELDSAGDGISNDSLINSVKSRRAENYLEKCYELFDFAR